MIGEWWIVLEYDQVDARSMEDKGPVYIPGEPSTAHLVYLSDSIVPSEEVAIDQVAQRGGHYAAFKCPPRLIPKKVSMVVGS